MLKAAEYFFSNPFSVLGVSCVSDNLEIIKAQEKIEKLAKLGAEKSYKTRYTSEKFLRIDRSSGIVQTAISDLDNPMHKLFWFSSSNVVENYDDTLLMVSLLNEPAQIEYDVFLLEYIDLVMNDCSFEQENRWKNLFKIISWYMSGGSDAIEKFLLPRKIEDGAFLFSKNILKPVEALCNSDNFEIGAKVLNILRNSNELELTTQFDDLKINIANSLIEQLDAMVSEKTAFAQGIDINDATSSTIVTSATDAANDIKQICELYADNLITLVDKISTDRLKDTIFSGLNICINVLLANSKYSKIKPFLTVYKKYAPNTQKSSISETEKVIKELSLCEAEVQRKRENSELDSQDLSLLNHKDVQVKMLAFRAFGGDNEYLGILGNIFMTKIYERNAPIDIPYNPAKGVRLLEKAAANGNDTAKVNLGMYYLVGNGVPQNISKARKYIEEAYDNGNSAARELMGDYRVRAIFDRDKTNYGLNNSSSYQSEDNRWIVWLIDIILFIIFIIAIGASN